MTVESASQAAIAATTPDSAISSDIDSTDTDYNICNEGNSGLDALPEETELHQSHGGNNRERFVRGRFGRNGRFSRLGSRGFGRFARFGGLGRSEYGWDADSHGDDCGNCGRIGTI
ncbi:hypothetical protein K7432_016028 [Basidiobolus ranarum]|uniref:Uncharacterized protein n=1 Tax=Basidiobolus ranarum TaxID=34480 RepID=A0ABR2VMD9_9FUNG